MNNLLFFGALFVAFSGVVVMAKLCGKAGLTAWVAIATILANIAVTKQVDMFGVSTTLGNIMFASTYICTDIISEVFTLRDSRRAVNVGMLSAITFIMFAHIVLRFVPNENDFVQASMENLFTMAIRTTCCSVICFYLANLADVYMFEKLKQLSPEKLWLRNNVCTTVCNCGENFLFCTTAFWGTMDVKSVLGIAVGTSVIELIVALCDTPFVYLGRRLCLRE